ncbi:SKP1-like protein 12 [Syzygium oleosum]|uniref:SKP1-like protein 12 n=1 Tax=Syzygium oleosum TaxID=219896 RepID=UPI0024B91464|nr:SKP1-like protein 12 [Syzygium oleosum]
MTTTEGSARVYRLQSYQGQVFLVDKHVALQIPLVRRRQAEAEAGGVILMEASDTKSLGKVLEWCEMHTPEKKATVPPDELRKWEDGYIDPCRCPIRLLIAAAFMEFEELEHWLSNRIAAKAIALAGKDPDEMLSEIRARIRSLGC